jgi:nitrous oxidase accessory protein NosD
MFRTSLALLVLFSTSGFARVAAATTRCVKPGGGSGCFATITLALAGSTANDLIRVSAGTYVENITIDKTLTLEGGWDTTFTTRNPLTFTSTITPATATSVVAIQGNIADPTAVTPTLDGFTITGGTADVGGNHGGGLRVRWSNATVRGCTITGNHAYLLGGGVWVQASPSPRFESNAIASNLVHSNGGSASSSGGGVYLESSGGTFVGNTIDGNIADDEGDSGGGLYATGAASLSITGGSISNNRAGAQTSGQCRGEGGGILALQVTSLSVDAVRIVGNCASFDGGGISVFQSNWRLTNSLLRNNDGGGNGDAMLIDTTSPGTIANATFVGLGSGRGVSSYSPLAITNTIVTGFLSGIDVSGGATATASYSDFYGNGTNTTGITLGGGNITSNPLLDSNSRLSAGSPAIDAGTSISGAFHDFDLEPRPMAGPGGHFKTDIGADEWPGDVQSVVDADAGQADLVIRGPGNPPENPNSNGSNDWIGYSILGDDVTGDGHADLVVAAEDWSNDFDVPSMSATGRLFGLANFGARVTGTRDLLVTPPDLVIHSEMERQHPGTALASGDLNGDGVRDLLIGSYENDNVPNDFVYPSVFALFGPLPASTDLATVSSANFTLRAAAQDFFYFSARGSLAVGNLGSTSADDLVVGDARADDGGLADAGAIYVVFGRTTLSGVQDLALTPADFTLYGPAASAQLGGVALGRLNGDAQLDLAARTPTTAYVLLGPLSPGARHLSSASADVRITGLTDGPMLVMDFTGDGRDDLVLGSGDDLVVIPGPFSAGQVLDASTAATVRLTGAKARSLAAADVVGDVRRDLIVGSNSQRTVFVVSAGVTASGSVPIGEVASRVLAGASQRNLGWDVAGGDLDFDGRPDLLATAWQTEDPNANGANPKFKDIGKAFVVYGGGVVDNCPGLANAAQTDGDADGVGNACDNCPLFANGNQQDLGGLGAGSTHDGVGDACQCGDLSDDGTVDAADVSVYRAYLANPSASPLSAAAQRKCRVRGAAAACDVAQVAVLRRALATPARPPGIAQVCVGATGS